MADLMVMRMLYNARIARTRREVDNVIVHSMATVKQLQALWGGHMVAAAKVAVMRLVNVRPATEVEHLRVNLKAARACYVKECLVVVKLRLIIFTYRMVFVAVMLLWQWTRRPWLTTPLWWSTICARPWSSTRWLCRHRLVLTVLTFLPAVMWGPVE